MCEREIALWLQVFLKTKFRIPLADHHNKTFCVYSGAYFQPTHRNLGWFPSRIRTELGSQGQRGLSVVAVPCWQIVLQCS